MKLTSHNHSGFSLLELLLVVAVLTVLLTGVAVTFNNWFSNSIDRKVARQIKDLQKSAENYVGLNFENVHDSLVPNSNDIAEIPSADLIANGLLSQGYTAQNAYRQTMRVFIRNVDNNPARPVIEVVTLSDNPASSTRRIDYERLISAVTDGGPSVGLISNLSINSVCCNGNIQSLQGTWSIPLATYGTLYNATPDNTGGYIAAYGRITNDTTSMDNYLFRQSVSGAPELNRMDTNLDMNGKNIVNAGVITLDNAKISGNAALSGQGQSPYVLSVRDGLNVNKNLNVRRSGDTKGEVTITGDNTAAVDFVVNNGMSVLINNGPTKGQLTSNGLFTQNLTTNNDVVINSSANMNNRSLTGNNIYITTMQYDHGVNVGSTLQAASARSVRNVTAPNVVSKTTNVTVGNTAIPRNLQVDGSFAVQGNTNISSTLNSQNTLTIQNMTNCNTGCP